MVMQQQKKNVIWDLSGTLLTMSTEHLSPQELEDSSLLLYLWASKKKPSYIDSLAVSFMESIPFEGDRHAGIVRNPAGQAIPEIVYRFLAGIVSSKEALNTISTFLPQWLQTKNPLSKEETNHLKQILITFFTPSSIARCFKPDQSLATVLQEASRNQSIKNFTLSNWDKASFSLIYKEYTQPIFSFFKEENIVISGFAGFLKPETAIFNYFLNKYQLPPDSFLFIDDQMDNITAAQSLGIEGIQYKPTTIDNLVLRLRELSLL